MREEWLTEICASSNPRDIRLKEMATLQLSNEGKERLLDRSEQFQRWIDAEWNPFIADLLPGDEVWSFRSPDHSWENLAGRAGYAIVRGRKIIRSLVTLMN